MSSKMTGCSWIARSWTRAVGSIGDDVVTGTADDWYGLRVAEIKAVRSWSVALLTVVYSSLRTLGFPASPPYSRVTKPRSPHKSILRPPKHPNRTDGSCHAATVAMVRETVERYIED